jgi:hypothetical protein
VTAATHFLGPLLRANSGARQLRGLCFPGSALNGIGFPPIKQPLAAVEGVASEGVFGESRSNGILANAAAVCITSDLRVTRPKISSSATELPVPQWAAGSDASQNQGSLPGESSAERSTHGARPLRAR